MTRWLVSVLLLAGCSGANETPVNLASLVTRAQLDQVDTPLLAARLTGPGTLATMVPVGRNGPVVTWRSADEVSISLNQGVLVATRGLGQDLMAADVSDVLGILKSASTQDRYTRVHSYLDGEYQAQLFGLSCQVNSTTAERLEIIEHTYQTTRIEESCFSDGMRFSNTYWVGRKGTVWKTRQWVSPALGYMETELLVQ